MARTHGWNGNPPATDQEAIDRILDAARTSIDRHGGRATISHVAQTLGVTRQTVYRYFPGTDALLHATSIHNVGGFLDRLSEHVAKIDDPVSAIIESMVFVIDQLPRDPQIAALLTARRIGTFSREITSDTSMTFGRAMTQRFAAGWTRQGITEETINEFVEWSLRVLQSFLIDPGRPPRHGQALRTYLNTWFAPTLRLQLPTTPTTVSQ